jgi:uncharacterized protein (TIGR02996 family)
MTDAELAELLRTVIARPDDHDVLRIYADCLLDRGDPRGELIAVQLQRRADTTDALVARERELATHLEGVLAVTLSQPGLATAWRNGFLDGIDFEPVDGRIALADSLRKLGTLPEARQLRRIVVRFVEPGWGATGPIISALTRLAPQFRALREIAFTTSARADTTRAVAARPGNFGDLSALTRAIPRLEVLEISTADYAALRDIQVPNLRRLVLEHPTSYDVARVADLRIPELAALEIHGLARFHDLQRVLVRDLPLRHLVVVTSLLDVMRHLSHNLPDATLCRGLETLVLAGTPLDKACVDSLVHHAAHLRRLRRFEIDGAVSLGRLQSVLGDRLVVG